MNKAQIVDLVKEGSVYRGLIQCEALGQGKDVALRFRHAKTENSIDIPCVYDKEEYRFEFDATMLQVKKGVYEIDLYEASTEKLYQVLVDQKEEVMFKGKYNLDYLVIEKSSRVYFPTYDSHKRLQFVICSLTNPEYFKVTKIACQNYVTTEKEIRFENLSWDEISCKEIKALFSENGGRVIEEMPMEYGKDLSYSLDTIKEVICENAKFKRYRAILLINDGEQLQRCWIYLNQKAEQPIVDPVLATWEDPVPVDETEEVEEVEKEIKKLMLYYTTNYYAAFAYEEQDAFYGKYAIANIEKFAMKNEKITMQASYVDFSAVPTKVRLAQRFEESYMDFPIQKTWEKKGVCYLNATIDLSAFQMIPFYLDFYVVFEYQGREILARVGCKRIRDSHLNKRLIRYTYRTGDGYVAYPYSTMYNKLSLVYREITKYDANIYKVKEMVSAWLYKGMRYYLNRKDIWLVCEKNSEMAQDNGFYFFKYCMDHNVNHKVYYIMDKESPDYKRLLPYKKNVIPFMSIRHMLLMQSKVILVSSEGKSNYFARKYVRGRIVRRFANKRYVFLQHGVIALKRIDSTFSKAALKAKLFVTSSEFEKSIITENFGYNDDEVIVTGLTRWDVLQDKSKEQPMREIVLMPTWRTWLEKMTEEEFLESDYYQMYSSLLQKKELVSFIKEKNIRLNFVIHPMLKKYVSKFASACDNIQIYQFGEAPINEIIMKASLLITDYSSVSWDFCYMNKPIIYFRFDIERYEEEQGAYVDLREDIVGDVCYDVDGLIQMLKKSVNQNYIVDEKFVQNRKNYFAYEDKNNCQRVLDEISKKYYE